MKPWTWLSSCPGGCRFGSRALWSGGCPGRKRRSTVAWRQVESSPEAISPHPSPTPRRSSRCSSLVQSRLGLPWPSVSSSAMVWGLDLLDGRSVTSAAIVGADRNDRGDLWDDGICDRVSQVSGRRGRRPWSGEMIGRARTSAWTSGLPRRRGHLYWGLRQFI